MKLSERITKLLSDIQKDVYEKETVFSLSLLAMLGGESIFLLGKPGVAKSLIARRLKYAFKQATNFEYLMNRFSTPEELFGPISIKALQEGKYERLIGDYLPAADVCFLDEIWKASPSIQNTLLTVINEKIFRNAGKDIHVPLKVLLSASNELPAEGEGLEALFDRFIIRYIVSGIGSETAFNTMLSGQTELDVKIDPTLAIGNDEYSQWLREAKNIKVGQLTFDFISRFRKRIAQVTHNTAYISDRRWKKMVGLMKTSAFFNDRTEVDKSDWLIINHCIWDTEAQQREYVRIFNEFYVENLVYEFRSKRELLTQKIAEIKKALTELGDRDIIRQEYTNPYDGKIKGRYYRIISNDLDYPICYISIAAFNKIKRNAYATTTLFLSKDLTNLEKKVKLTLNFISESELQNSESEAIFKMEIANSSTSKRIKYLQKKILDVEDNINTLNAELRQEKARLLTEPAIFFQEQMGLMINQAFASEEVPIDIKKFQERSQLTKESSESNVPPVDDKTASAQTLPAEKAAA